MSITLKPNGMPRAVNKRPDAITHTHYKDYEPDTNAACQTCDTFPTYLQISSESTLKNQDTDSFGLKNLM